MSNLAFKGIYTAKRVGETSWETTEPNSPDRSDHSLKSGGWTYLPDPPVLFDAMFALWRNAETPNTCQEGDLIIAREDRSGGDSYVITQADYAYSLGPFERILHRATDPQVDRLAALIDEIANMPADEAAAYLIKNGVSA